MFSDPLKNLKVFGIKETDIVADLGAGTGFYTILAASIASNGKVYAIELSRDFLEIIANKAKEAKLENVKCMWGDAEKPLGTKLGTETMDKVIISNVFFQIENKQNFLSEVKRILKKDGEALLIDWSEDSPIPGKSLVVPKTKAKEMFETLGLKLTRDVDAGLHHYGMIFVKTNK